MTDQCRPNGLFWSPSPSAVHASPAMSRASGCGSSSRCSSTRPSPSVSPSAARSRKVLSDEVVDSMGTSFSSQYLLRSKLGDGMTASVYICAATASTMTSSISATSGGASRFACKLAEQRVHVSNWTRVVAVLEHEASLLRRLGEHDHIVRQVSPRLWQVSPRVFPFVTAHVGPSATAHLTHPSPSERV